MRSEGDLEWRVRTRFRRPIGDFAGRVVLDAGAGAGIKHDAAGEVTDRPSKPSAHSPFQVALRSHVAIPRPLEAKTRHGRRRSEERRVGKKLRRSWSSCV